MKIIQLVICILLAALNAFGASTLKRDDFFETILSEPNELDAPAKMLNWTFDDPIFDWLRTHAAKIYFGDIIPKAIPSTYSDEKKAIIEENIKQMLSMTGRAKDLSLEDLLGLIDNKIDDTSFDDSLSAAKAFRHLRNTVANKNHPLGDFICFYIIASKILVSNENKIDISKIWLSDAYYELSQVYSHLIDYDNKNWKSDGKLYLFSELTDGKKRILTSFNADERLLGVSYFRILNTKLNLLKYSLLNNLANNCAWVRAIEFAAVDIPEGEKNRILSRDLLPMTFDLQDKTEELVAFRFDEIVKDPNHTFLPGKFNLIKSRFNPVILRVISNKLKTLTNKKAARKLEIDVNKKKPRISVADKENQAPQSVLSTTN